jgi:hypothetical protein
LRHKGLNTRLSHDVDVLSEKNKFLSDLGKKINLFSS